MLQTRIEEQLSDVDKIIGLKQSMKKLREDCIRKAYIAKDADKKVVGNFEKLCGEKNIEIEYVATKFLLGKASGIKVGASIVSIVKE